MRLQEVRSAMLNFKDESSLEVVGNADSLLDVMNLAELYVKKIITFCKNFSAFTCLKLADQLIMLKSFHPEIGAIGASFLYNSKKDGLPVIAVSIVFISLSLFLFLLNLLASFSNHLTNPLLLLTHTHTQSSKTVRLN